jgi:hypothetical protein
MASQDKISTRDEIQVKLIGPDGKVKQTRKTKTKNEKWKKVFDFVKVVLTMILFLPIAIISFFLKKKN